jgi:predicted ATPase
VWEIRQALGDQVALPQYIETVGQQGYRFLAATRVGMAESTASGSEGADPPASATPFVGRQAALATLQDCLAQTQRGMLQLVLVSGDLGVGKTTLVQQFLARLSAAGAIWVGQGQCVDHVGPGEAYLPLLDALGRLGQASGGERLVAALRRVAPLWLIQLPLLVETPELEALQRQVHGVGHARMLRELVEALGVVTRDTLLVLVLEDLHWSDASTVEWLAYLARRSEPLQLLVLGTYRSAEVIARGHSLRQTVQELGAHGLCQELRLELLTQEEVEAYVAQRLGATAVSAELAALIHRRTDGNALFMGHFLDYLVQQGLLIQDGGQWMLRENLTAVEEQVPDTLQPLLLKQVEALPTDAQQCLAVASVAGIRFTAAEVAAGLQRPIEDVEAICDGLSQQGQLIEARDVVAWPDGTVTAQYGFRHALYHNILYARLGQGQRVRLHHRLGERLEAGYRQQGHEIASMLAYHFERGRDARRTVQYHGHAAAQALQRSAYPEALLHCQQGLAGLATWPDTPERTQQELALRTSLHAVLVATQGFTSPALAQSLQRAQVLCQESEATAAFVPILTGLTRLAMMHADRQATEALMAREQDLLEELDDPAALVQLHTQLGTAHMFRGTPARALEHHEHALRLYDPDAHRALAVVFGGDPAAVALALSSWSLWLSGWPDQAWQRVEFALARSEAVGHLFSLVVVLFQAVVVRQFRGEYDAAGALTQHLIELARAQGFTLYETFGMLTQGGILVQQGEPGPGAALITTGLTQSRTTGMQLLLPFFLAFLAEAALRQGQVADGLHAVAEALQLTATNFDRFWEAELHRLQGELLLAQAGTQHPGHGSGAADAARCFQQALDIARRQEAKSLELRAAMSLSRLWQAQGRHAEAHMLLAGVYGWFTEGFDTADLQAAQALLKALKDSPQHGGCKTPPE